MLTGVTGLIYWWMDEFLQPIDEFAIINHPLQPWLLKAHIIIAPVLVFALGVIWMNHIWKHIRISMQGARKSGLIAVVLITPMVFSGYLIQAVISPVLLTVLIWIHIGGGLFYLLGLLVHKLAADAYLKEACPVRALPVVVEAAVEHGEM
mgnify:FL=1